MTYSQSVHFDAEIIPLSPRPAEGSDNALPDANWTSRLHSSALRAEIAANPRLARRVAQLCSRQGREKPLAQHGSHETQAPSPHSQPLYEADSRPRAAAQAAPAADPGKMAFDAYMARQTDIIRMAGLIWNAAGLARIIAGPQLRILSQSVSEAEMHYALSNLVLAMDDAPFSSFEPLPVADRLRRSGEQAVAAWALQLSPALQERVLQSLSDDARLPPAADCDNAVTVLLAALHGPVDELERAA